MRPISAFVTLSILVLAVLASLGAPATSVDACAFAGSFNPCPAWTRALTELDGVSLVGGALAPDGTLYVAGYAGPAGGASDIFIAALDPSDGHELWRTRWDGPAAGEDAVVDASFVRPVAYDALSDMVIVGGFSTTTAGGRDFTVLGIEAASGAVAWTFIDGVAGTGFDGAYAVEVSAGAAFVAGITSPDGHDFDGLVVRLDAATGAEAWSYTHSAGGLGSDVFFALDVNPDGETLTAVGYATTSLDPFGFEPNGWDYSTVTLATDGGLVRWADYHNGTLKRRDIAMAATTSPDGAVVYVTGQSQSQWSSMDAVTIAYDVATGARLWTNMVIGLLDLDEATGIIPWTSTDYGAAIDVSPDGSRLYLVTEGVTCACVPFVGGALVDYETQILSLDAATGVATWSRHQPQSSAPGHAARALDGGVLVLDTGIGSARDVRLSQWDAFGTPTALRQPPGPQPGDEAPRALLLDDEVGRAYIVARSVMPALSGQGYVVAYELD